MSEHDETIGERWEPVDPLADIARIQAESEELYLEFLKELAGLPMQPLNK